MEEDGEDRQRCHEAHKEKVDAEEALRDSAPVRKLILHKFLRDEPAEEDTGEETTDGEEDLTRDKVEDIEQRLATNLKSAPVTQRQRADGTNDGTCHRDDDGTFLAGDMKFLIEKGGRHLMKGDKRGESSQREEEVEQQGHDPPQNR